MFLKQEIFHHLNLSWLKKRFQRYRKIVEIHWKKTFPSMDTKHKQHKFIIYPVWRAHEKHNKWNPLNYNKKWWWNRWKRKKLLYIQVIKLYKVLHIFYVICLKAFFPPKGLYNKQLGKKMYVWNINDFTADYSLGMLGILCSLNKVFANNLNFIDTIMLNGNEHFMLSNCYTFIPFRLKHSFT